ncbi:hypothetical protein F2Q70_00041837 [Brassica cretica]|uniref:F-box domain-containing protein n=1 Tax=Brassica cretica TaxID=69181 RepID=A0A8S9K7S3_BRACR|nr:hypothetical protein F2Q70_00041837 [Brassica cretica]
MDRISGLSDELLVKILSFLPTEDAVSTSVLSKQWRFLWMRLPKLEYHDYYAANPPRHFRLKVPRLHRQESALTQSPRLKKAWS